MIPAPNPQTTSYQSGERRAQMADDQDLRKEDDVEGHTFAKNPEPKDSPRVAAEVEDEDDDVEGHVAAQSPEPGKKESPGLQI
jgi:hypothetical protein